MKKVRVAYTKNAAGNAPMTLGLKSGIFNKHGIDLEMIAVDRGGLAIEEIMTDGADFAVVSGAPIVHSILDDKDPVIVMSVEGHNVFAIMAKKGIVSPEQIRGGTVGVSGPTDADRVMMFRALDDWGIDPKTDVTVRSFEGGRGEIWDALLSGEIDAMAATIPEPLNARAQGIPILREFYATEEVYQSGALVSTLRFVHRKEDLVKQVIRAQVESVKYFVENPEEGIEELKQHLPRILNLDVLKETHRLFGRDMSDFVPNLGAIENTAQNMARVFGTVIPKQLSIHVNAEFAQSIRDEQ